MDKSQARRQARFTLGAVKRLLGAQYYGNKYEKIPLDFSIYDSYHFYLIEINSKFARIPE